MKYKIIITVLLMYSCSNKPKEVTKLNKKQNELLQVIRKHDLKSIKEKRKQRESKSNKTTQQEKKTIKRKDQIIKEHLKSNK